MSTRTPSPASGRYPQFRDHRILAFAFICLSAFVISVDSTIVNVAPPTLSRELDAAYQVIGQLPQPVIADVRGAVNTAFLDGMQVGSLVCPGIALAAAIVVAWMLPARARQAVNAVEAQPEAVSA